MNMGKILIVKFHLYDIHKLFKIFFVKIGSDPIEFVLKFKVVLLN